MTFQLFLDYFSIQRTDFLGENILYLTDTDNHKGNKSKPGSYNSSRARLMIDKY